MWMQRAASRGALSSWRARLAAAGPTSTSTPASTSAAMSGGPEAGSSLSLSGEAGPRTPSDAPYTRVTVASARLVSPDVRHLVLSVPRESTDAVQFKAGQYLDVQPAGKPWSAPGGLSLCSAPSSLSSAGTLEVAVKRSSQESLRWLYGDAGVGSEVDVRVGGKAFGDASVGVRPLLLVAGGIGVAPMLSMLRDRKLSGRVAEGCKTYFMYVARTEADLAFREQVEALLLPDEMLLKVTMPYEALALDADEWAGKSGGARRGGAAADAAAHTAAADAARDKRLPSGRFTTHDYRAALKKLTGVDGVASSVHWADELRSDPFSNMEPPLSDQERAAYAGVSAAVCGPQAMNERVADLLLNGLGVGEVLVERW